MTTNTMAPADVRRLLEDKDFNLDSCLDEDTGLWESPITGKMFPSKYALSGHIGALARDNLRTPMTEDRAGYVKALRNGIEPTDKQRQAHRNYMRQHRLAKRQQISEE